MKIKNKSNFQLVFELIFFKTFFWLLFQDCPLAGNTRRLFEVFFLLFNLVTSAITACNVGVFKKTLDTCNT